ncbi:MAG: glycosyltransferase family A protein [Brachybacterium sp.]|nr:glycosyltransferase family A protein [Brachybacterium sp.]
MSSHDRQPVASVIVPTYRGVQRLPALIDALAGQSPGTPPFEVIVVVDGEDDGTVDLLDREDRIDVHAIAFPENRGRVAALNSGFDAARGEVLIRCDDDLVPDQDYIRFHVKGHTDGPTGVVGLYRNVFERTRYAAVYGEAADHRFRAEAYAAPKYLRWRYWAGNCSINRARRWAAMTPSSGTTDGKTSTSDTGSIARGCRWP